MKIVRHAQQTGPSSSFSAGQLLGLDTAGLLEVSDSYAFPPNHVFPISEASEERDYNRGRREDGFDQAAVNAHNYTAQFLPRLAELNADANVVGFYATTSNGQVSGQNGALIEALARYQSGTASEPTTAVAKLRAKAPERKGPGKGIALVYGQFCLPRTVKLKVSCRRLQQHF
jgi:translation initiation factor 3 subunit H